MARYHFGHIGKKKTFVILGNILSLKNKDPLHTCF